MAQPVPLLVLAGSDREPATLPEGAEVQPLVGTKSLDIVLQGRPLIDHVLERMTATGAFAPVYVAGPRAKFGDTRGDATVIDTDSTLASNIQTALEHVQAAHPGSTIAIATCDILPHPDELAEVIADWRAAGDRPFWFASIRVPPHGRLGASSWKPRYRCAETVGGEPIALLPSHVVFVRPHDLRLPLLYRCFHVAYRGRNRSVAYRLSVMVGYVVGGLLAQDLRRLLRFERPDVTVTCLANGITLGRRLAAGTATVPEVEGWLTAIYVRRAWRDAHPGMTGRLAILDGLSLAKDIDTREEAEEIRRQAASIGQPLR
jgi:hypothetical protein